jgi:hypothetical protein
MINSILTGGNSLNDKISFGSKTSIVNLKVGDTIVLNKSDLRNITLRTESVCDCVFYMAHGDSSEKVVTSHIYRGDKDTFYTDRPIDDAKYLGVLKETFASSEKVKVFAFGGNFTGRVLPTKRDFQNQNLSMVNYENGEKFDYKTYRNLRLGYNDSYSGLGARCDEQPTNSLMEYTQPQGRFIFTLPDLDKEVCKVQLTVRKPHPDPGNDEGCYHHSFDGEWDITSDHFVGMRNLRLLKKALAGLDFELVHYFTRLNNDMEMTFDTSSNNFAFTSIDPKNKERQSIALPALPCFSDTLK